MFVLLFFLVIGMALTWIGVVIYAVVNANAEVKRRRQWNKDFDRAIAEMDTSGEPWQWRMPKWYTDKYGDF